jgi:hypothetical protein
VIYKGILGKIPEFLVTKCGWPVTLLGCPACPWALFDSVFSGCIPHAERSTFILWNPLNHSTHLLLPHFSSKTLVHPLPYHGSLQCSVHHCHHKNDSPVDRGITRQGHVMCVDRIDRPTEGLRCCKGGQ